MGCRCQERRAALQRAMRANDAKTAGKELRFVASTMATDASHALKLRLGLPVKKENSDG